MTSNEIISNVDALMPSQYDKQQKLDWLSQLDGQIFIDVICTHECMAERIADRVVCDEDNPGVNLYPAYVTGDELLIVGEPYGSIMYQYWLQAMISKENSEIAKYSQYQTLYNSAYLDWVGFYNRHHLPRQPRRGNRFLF